MAYTQEKIQEIVANQRSFFRSGVTLDVKWRLQQLKNWKRLSLPMRKNLKGTGNKETRRFAPTMIYPVKIDENIVRRELFCPLLPIVPFSRTKKSIIWWKPLQIENTLLLCMFSLKIWSGQRRLCQISSTVEDV